MVQLKLVKLLARKNNRIFVVGDDDQSIYSWRGARIQNILSFDKEFPDTRVFKLEQNYRSTKAILDFANSIISSNSKRADKRLWTSKKYADDVMVVRYRDDRHEADATCERIKQLQLNKVRLGTISILFRTNAQSRIFEDVFRKYGIPYIIVGGVSFYERKEIKDCLAYLRLLVNPKDNISCERIINVPSRGIGAKTIKILNEIAFRDKISLLDTILFLKVNDLHKRALNGLQKLRKIFLVLRELLDKKAPPHEILLEMLSLSEYIDILKSDNTEESRVRIENINELMNVISLWNKENPQKSLVDFLE
jgi:DNA helicase-2/ATP-dependent DNA helicase PcrA